MLDVDASGGTKQKEDINASEDRRAVLGFVYFLHFAAQVHDWGCAGGRVCWDAEKAGRRDRDRGRRRTKEFTANMKESRAKHGKRIKKIESWPEVFVAISVCAFVYCIRRLCPVCPLLLVLKSADT